MLLDLQQDTEAWKEYRKRKLGASDAIIIMGVSPWTTPIQLWEQKLGLRGPQFETESMRRGKEMEHIARIDFIHKTGHEVFPAVFESEDHPWMIASMDGISKDHKIGVEIKCPGFDDHQVAVNGEVPEKYIPQLQHQMAVTGLQSIFYFSFYQGNGILVEVNRDDNYIKGMIKEEKKFWESLQSLEPPDLMHRDYVIREDKEWKEKSIAWMQSKESLRLALEKEDQCRRDLIDICEGKSCYGNGVKVSKQVRKGAIDYKSIPHLQGYDLEKHRSPPKDTWRLSTG